MEAKLNITNWKRGYTMMTTTVRSWSADKVAKNDKVEAAMIFSNFTAVDAGTSRQLVCALNANHPDYEQNAKLIASAPLLYEALQELLASYKMYVKKHDQNEFIIQATTALSAAKSEG